MVSNHQSKVTSQLITQPTTHCWRNYC